MLVFDGQGEPLLHEHILDFLTIAKQYELKPMLFTNGILLKEATLQTLIEVQLDLLKVSLWASTPEEYARNYPTADPDCFPQILSYLHRLKLLKSEYKSRFPRVEWCHPINRHNYQNIENLVHLAGQTGCDSIFFSPLIARTPEFSELSLTSEEEIKMYRTLRQLKKPLAALSLQHNIDEVLQRYQFGASGWRQFPCYISWYRARVRPDGSVGACNSCEVTLGNLYQRTFAEIWDGEAFRDFRRNTMTREGLAAMSSVCQCDYCCHLFNNYRISRIMRWFFWLKPRPIKASTEKEHV